MQASGAVVIGLGVSGLTTGVRLLEAGFAVHALTAAPPHSTTSAVAAAIWYPYRVGPEDRVDSWAAASLKAFAGLAQDPKSGVRWVEGLEVIVGDAPLNPWQKRLPGLRPARVDELPSDRARGIVFRVPCIEMPIYLPWLEARFRGLGGTSEIATVTSLEPLRRSYALVVDCAGLGARELAGDQELYPIRGQIVRIAGRVVERFVVDDTGGDDFAFLVPRSHDVILGGSAHKGRCDMLPLAHESDAIVERCAHFEARVQSAQRLEAKVGLRPGRHAVRLELEQSPGLAPLLHNYGHGGAGVTLSWGCADEIVRRAQELLGSQR